MLIFSMIIRAVTEDVQVWYWQSKTIFKQDKQHNIEALLCNDWCRVFAIRYAYSECVSVTLVIQHAKRMRSDILSPEACLIPQSFSILPRKG